MCDASFEIERNVFQFWQISNYPYTQTHTRNANGKLHSRFESCYVQHKMHKIIETSQAISFCRQSG